MKTKTQWVCRLAMAFAMVVIYGCSALPRPAHYMLTSAVPATKQLIKVSVILPDYLAGPSIVLMTPPHEIHYASMSRWGEPLHNGVARVLRNQLAKTSSTLTSASLDVSELMAIRGGWFD